MEEENTEKPENAVKSDGKISQFLLTVKSAGPSYGSFTNSFTCSDISSITSVDDLDHIDSHDEGSICLLFLLLVWESNAETAFLNFGMWHMIYHGICANEN